MLTSKAHVGAFVRLHVFVSSCLHVYCVVADTPNGTAARLRHVMMRTFGGGAPIGIRQTPRLAKRKTSNG